MPEYIYHILLPSEVRKGVSELLEWELQTSHTMWVLRIKARASGSASSVFKPMSCPPLPPVPYQPLLKIQRKIPSALIKQSPSAREHGDSCYGEGQQCTHLSQ